MKQIDNYILERLHIGKDFNSVGEMDTWNDFKEYCEKIGIKVFTASKHFYGLANNDCSIYVRINAANEKFFYVNSKQDMKDGDLYVMINRESCDYALKNFNFVYVKDYFGNPALQYCTRNADELKKILNDKNYREGKR